MSFLSFVSRTLSGGSSSNDGSMKPPNMTPQRRSAKSSSSPSAKLFTIEDVAKHATEGDCYTIVEGKVYDVTKYLRLHPGGFKLLFKNAGGDSTTDFLALRHSAKSRVILDQYYVGELVSSHTATLHPTANGRKVGAMVGAQPFLSVAPTGNSGSTTPQVTSSTTSTQYSYPPPRSGSLHPSSSHPDRLTAYKDQQDKSAVAIPIVSSSTGLSINLLPPSIPPSTCPPLQRSPTRDALEKHLAAAESLSPTDERMEEASSSATPPIAPRALRADLMTIQISPAEPLPTDDRMDTSTSIPVITPSSSASSASSAAASAMDTTSTTALAPSFGPRLFSLTRRIQRTHDVQLLTFEPIFATAATASSTSSSTTVAAASSMDATATTSVAHPSSLDPAFWFHVPCGMHITIGHTLPNGEFIKRPYTPVSNQRGQFELLVKTYPYGLMSKYLHQLPLGSQLDVFGPFGKFDYEQAIQYSRWVMIAQGTGIAPMYQLIQHVCAAAATNSSTSSPLDSSVRQLQLNLLDCNRHEDDILLHAELSTLERESGGRLQIQHLLSKPSSPPYPPILTGRLNSFLLDQYLTSLSSTNLADSISPTPPNSNSPPSPFSSTLFLVCGSDEFHRDVVQLLQQSTVSPLDAKKTDQVFLF